MILAPLRGVTIRSFRETFAEEIRAAGFTEAITPFIAAISGYDPLRDRELGNPTIRQSDNPTIRITPQFIGKDPKALRDCLEKIRAAGYATADLNCGCPYPMVRRKGRGSGLLRTPDVLRKMLEVGCEVMGPNRFSVKVRLGVERSDELLGLMPIFNAFPLRFLTLHARTAKQMYAGSCDVAMAERIAQVAKMPIVYNGDVELSLCRSPLSVASEVMIGRGFIRHLGMREDASALMLRYLEVSAAELCGDVPVLGRMKELLAYWQDLPCWHRCWGAVKLCRTLTELRSCLTSSHFFPKVLCSFIKEI